MTEPLYICDGETTTTMKIKSVVSKLLLSNTDGVNIHIKSKIERNNVTPQTFLTTVKIKLLRAKRLVPIEKFFLHRGELVT